jgi:hypothetical protein
MILYQKPDILSFSPPDLVELFGPAETQYTFVVSHTVPPPDGDLLIGKNIQIQVNNSLNAGTVSPADILIEKSADLNSAGAPGTTAVSVAALSWDVSVVTTTLPNDTILVDPHNLKPGEYELTIPVTGQDVQSSDGLHLVQFMFNFDVEKKQKPTPTPTPTRTPTPTPTRTPTRTPTPTPDPSPDAAAGTGA